MGHKGLIDWHDNCNYKELIDILPTGKALTKDKLNALCYFLPGRRQSKEPLPYMDNESKYADIEDPQNIGRAVCYSYYEAWKLSPAYHKILRCYSETDKITDKPWYHPMEGFFLASVDTDPTKDYDYCSQFSLICYKTGTSVHI